MFVIAISMLSFSFFLLGYGFYLDRIIYLNSQIRASRRGYQSLDSGSINIEAQEEIGVGMVNIEPHRTFSE